MPGKNKKKKSVTPARGERIRFVRGVYAGERGWINSAKSPTDSYVHVVLDCKQEAKDDADYATCVKKNSIMRDAHPKNAEQYVVQEDPKVAFHLGKFCEALAEAGFADAGATDEMLAVVGAYINLACQLQTQKGRKAKYSDVAWQVKELLKSKKKRAAIDTNAMSV